MRVLLASSELYPYSKTGGLADMAAALAKFLARAGNEVGVVTPLYGGIRERFRAIQPFDWRLEFALDGHRVSGSVWCTRPEPNLTLYFVDQPGFFRRDGLYGNALGDYRDNAERFVFFSLAVVNFARYLPWKPQLVHVHDWHAGLVPLLIHHTRQTSAWPQCPHTCLTIHNLAYQGIYPAAKYALTGLPSAYFSVEGLEYHGQMNCLKGGIAHADALTTVSPTYASEIQTPAYGEGLDGLLRRRARDLTGILNGVDYDEWQTTANRHLAAPYDVSDLTGKATNKSSLQYHMGLPIRPEVPVFGQVSRLAHQKGVDFQLRALEETLAADIQYVVLGSGDPELQASLLALQDRHADKVAVRLGFNNALAHQIEAGSDFFLMPSRFEPCGLNQMYSLRYGTVPIVRATGGLQDSIVDVREEPTHANGIKFKHCSPAALTKAIHKALALFKHPELLHHFQVNGMTADFSWQRSTQQYQDLYHRLTRNGSPAPSTSRA